MKIGDRIVLKSSFDKEDVGKTGTVSNMYPDSHGRSCVEFFPDQPETEDECGAWVAFEEQLEVVE